MRKVIVAIGGGEIRTQGTAAIDQEIVRVSRKRHPRLLFIPTASSDSERYWKHVEHYFGRVLKCRMDVLYLIRERPSRNQVRERILRADIIYVGGGNTLQMMRVWRRRGVDRLLRLAYQRGTVLSGISAGAICWFDAGHSDSMFFYQRHNWKYIKVKGLGLVSGILCPHYNSRTRGVPRRKAFRDMIGGGSGIGIALDNNCAIEFVDDKFRVLTSKRLARAYTLRQSQRRVAAERIRQADRLAPIGSPVDRGRLR